MSDSIISKTISATKWSATTEIIAKCISPVTSMILARILAPEAFGVLTTVLMVIAFAEVFVDSGFQKYLIQHAFANEKERKGEDRFRIFGEYDPECINCFYYGNGFLYFEHMVPTKLERYRGEKTREYELLVVLQKYIRGEIDFTTFLPAHQAALGNLGLLKGMTERYYYGEAILKEYILGEKHGSKNNQS